MKRKIIKIIILSLLILLLLFVGLKLHNETWEQYFQWWIEWIR
jgi:hypothetical protein